MLFVAGQLFCLALIAVLLLCAGLPCARALGTDGLAQRLAWGFALGFLAWGVACQLAALAHALVPGLVAALALAVLALGGRDTLRLARDVIARLGSGRWRVAAFAAITFFAAPLLASALYPPYDWDETIYHLVFARAFAASGSLPFLIEARIPVFPPFAELLSAAVLLFADDVATHWLAIIATLSTAGLMLAWSGLARSTRLLAAALYLGAPMVVLLAGLGYVDPLLTLFTTAALAALEQSRRAQSLRWLAVSGLCAGAAASTKYLGLFVVAWIVAEAGFSWSGGRRARFAAASLVALSAAAVAGPVYGRIVLATGNPLFPFYPALFGGSSWAYAPEAVPPGSLLAGVLDSLGVVWRGVFDRGAVGGMPPFSPFWPFAVLVLLVGSFRRPHFRWPLAMLVAYLLAIPPNARYVLPLVPYAGLAGIASAAAIVVRRQLSPRALALCALGLALPGWAYCLYLLAQRGPVPTDAQSRDAFLGKRLECYSAVAFLNHAAPRRYVAYGLPLERLAGLAHGRWFGDVSGPWNFARAATEIERDGRAAPMLGEAGADYLVVEEPYLRRLERPVLASGGRLAFRDGACAVFALAPR